MASGDVRAEQVIIDFLEKILKWVPQFQSAESLSDMSGMLGITSIGGTIKATLMAAKAINSKKHIQCAAFGIKVCPGYGLTECANLTSGNVDADEFPESVGPVYPGQEVKIVDGELYIKGDNVMLGYYNDPEATKKAFSDG